MMAKVNQRSNGLWEDLFSSHLLDQLASHGWLENFGTQRHCAAETRTSRQLSSAARL